jgi:hypothetical protein
MGESLYSLPDGALYLVGTLASIASPMGRQVASTHLILVDSSEWVTLTSFGYFDNLRDMDTK